MYALQPAILLFNSQSADQNYNGKSKDPHTDSISGTVSGFAVKFWHWTNCEKSSIWSSQR